MRSYEVSLNGIADDVVVEIASRYMSGRIPGQNFTFAPSVAEFSKTARDLIDARIAARSLPDRRPEIAHEPIHVRKNRVRKQFEDRQILEENLSHENWLKRLREFPLGSEYVAMLETVYAA